MISISGFIFLNDIEQGRKYGTRMNHGSIEIDDVDGIYYVFLKLNPNQVDCSSYKLGELESINSHDKKIMMRFMKPNHEVVVMSDDISKVEHFLKNLRSLAKRLDLNISESFLSDALSAFANINNHNRFQNLNLTTLRMIALENCDLPSLPEGIGNLTISSLSLTGSKLNMSKCGQDLFWDWMTKENISTTLNVLEMNSIGLRQLPFEIIHLKHLRALLVSNNKLTHIPHFIGELQNLKTLMVNGNTLWYFPDSLLDKVFNIINILNNRFIHFKEPIKDDKCSGLRNVPKLLDLSILSLINNCVKFKRQEIPRPLWSCYDFVCRCRFCKKLFVFDEKYQHFTFTIPNTEKLIQIESIHWQYFKCRPSCVRLENINA